MDKDRSETDYQKQGLPALTPPSPIQDALPEWPRSQRNKTRWIGLHKSGFYFTHESSFAQPNTPHTSEHAQESEHFDPSTDYFCVPEREWRKLEALLERSEGGSVLITGYRGSGKSSLVKYTLSELNRKYRDREAELSEKTTTESHRNTFRRFEQIHINMSSPHDAHDLVKLMFKELLEHLKSNKAAIPKSIIKEVQRRYNRTISEKTEKHSLLTTLLSPVLQLQKDVENKYSRSTLAIAQSDLNYCIDLLQAHRIWLVFIFDELDKISPPGNDDPQKAHSEKLKQLQKIVADLKFLLSESNAFHILIAGKDVDDSWQEDQNKGEGLFESVFTLNIYLPSFFGSRLRPTLGPHKEWVIKRWRHVQQNAKPPSRRLSPNTTETTPESEDNHADQEKYGTRLITRPRKSHRHEACNRWLRRLLKIGLGLSITLAAQRILQITNNPFTPKKILNRLFEDLPFLEYIKNAIEFISSSWIFIITAFLATANFIFHKTNKMPRNIGYPLSEKNRKRIKRRFETRPLSKEEWKLIKEQENNQNLKQSENDEATQFVINEAIEELGISKKTWTYRTALLIIPHLAQYEIKALLRRRLYRIYVEERKIVKSANQAPDSEHHISTNELKLRILLDLPQKGPLNEDLFTDPKTIFSQRKCQRLQLFLKYLTYKGRGIPRKVLREFYTFVEHRSVVRTQRYDSEFWLKDFDDVDMIISIEYSVYQKMSFFANIVSHLERNTYFFRNLDDKGTVSTFHIIDYLLKFYRRGFSRRDLFNADFMTRRQELFPSQPLISRLLEILDGFLIAPTSPTSPTFVLLPRVQQDLSKLYLNFGPDQLELRFTPAEFQQELDDLEERSKIAASRPTENRLETFRLEVRRAKLFELLGSNFEARAAYGSALKWVMADLTNTLSEAQEDDTAHSKILEAKGVTYATFAIEIHQHTARIYEEMHEHRAALLHYHEAMNVHYALSENFQLNKIEETGGHIEAPISNPIALLIKSTPTQDLLQEDSTPTKLVLNSSHLEGKGSSQARLFWLITNTEHHWHLLEKQDPHTPSNRPNNKALPIETINEPENLHHTYNAAALVHEKGFERQAANRCLLMSYFYLLRINSEYAAISQMIFIGNFLTRRRQFRSALTWYKHALMMIANIRSSNAESGVRVIQEFSLHGKSELLGFISDISLATKGEAFLSTKDLYQLSQEKHLSYDSYIRAVRKGVFKFVNEYIEHPAPETRWQEYFISHSRSLAELANDKLAVIDAVLKKLMRREVEFATLIGKIHINSDAKEDNLTQLTELSHHWFSFFKGAEEALRLLCFSSTEKMRHDATNPGEIRDRRRFARLLQLCGLMLSNVSMATANLTTEAHLREIKFLLWLLGCKGGELPEALRNGQLYKHVETQIEDSFHEFKEAIPNSSIDLKSIQKGIKNWYKDSHEYTSELWGSLHRVFSYIVGRNVEGGSSVEALKEGIQDKFRPSSVSILWNLSHSEKTDQLMITGLVAELNGSFDKDYPDQRKALWVHSTFWCERALLSSVMIFRGALRDSYAGAANLSLGKLYLSSLAIWRNEIVDKFSDGKDKNYLKSDNEYRMAYSASKRFLVKALDIFRDEKAVGFPDLAVLGECYSCLADLMILRRILHEELKAHGNYPINLKREQVDLKIMDDEEPLDIQNQAFAYAGAAVDVISDELTEYTEGYRPRDDSFYAHRNMSDALRHHEICRAAGRRHPQFSNLVSAIRKDADSEDPTDKNWQDLLKKTHDKQLSELRRKLESLKRAAKAPSTVYEAELGKFLNDIAPLISLCNAIRPYHTIWNGEELQEIAKKLTEREKLSGKYCPCEDLSSALSIQFLSDDSTSSSLSLKHFIRSYYDGFSYNRDKTT